MKKRGVFSSITLYLGYAVIILLVAAIAFILISKSAGKLFYINGKTMVWVMSESMEPEIPRRSYIIVEKITADEVNVGDVIMFISDDPSIKGSYNTHRVVEIVGDHESFIMKGDNNIIEDEYPARAECVEARYVEKLEVLSRFGRFLSSQMGLMSSVSVVIALTAAIMLPELKRLQKAQEDEMNRQHEKEIEELVRLEIEKLREQNAGQAAPSVPEDGAESASEEQKELDNVQENEAE